MPKTNIGREREMKFAEVLRSRGLDFIYQPAPFLFRRKEPLGPAGYYRADFFVPAKGKYYEVIGSRQCLRDKKGAKLKRIEKAERLFGIKVEIVKPNGELYSRVLYGAWEEKKQAAIALWSPGITRQEFAIRLGLKKPRFSWTSSWGLRFKRKRPNQGMENPNAKLSPEQIAEIRGSYRPRTYARIRELATLFGVSPASIKKIVYRQNWKSLQNSESLQKTAESYK